MNDIQFVEAARHFGERIIELAAIQHKGWILVFVP